MARPAFSIGDAVRDRREAEEKERTERVNAEDRRAQRREREREDDRRERRRGTV